MMGRFLSRCLAQSLGVCSLLLFPPRCGSLLKEAERIQQKFEAGGGNGGGGGTACNPPLVGSVTPIYPSYANWLQYVRNDGTTPYNASQSACTPTATEGHYNSCIHAGELRRVPVTNRTSCAGLTGSDALNAFKWSCQMVTGVPNIVSGGLADEKFLSDLIDFSGAGSWRPNSVTVTDSCGSSATPATIWYANVITDISAVVTPTLTLSTTGTIHIAKSNPNKAIDITANHTAFVSQPGVMLTAPNAPAPGTHINLNGNFIWLEVTANSANATTWSVNGARFCHIRGSNFANQQAGLGNECRVGYTRFHDAIVRVENTHRIFMHDVTFAHSRIYFDGAASHNGIFLNSTLMSTDYGFSTGNGTQHLSNILINHTGANLSTSGLRGDGSGFRDSTFMNVLYMNTASSGYENGGTRNTLLNLAVSNSDNGIDVFGANNFLTGLLRIGTTGIQCSGSGTAGINSSCVANQASNFVTPIVAIDLSTALGGKATADASNSHGATGTVTAAAMTDFFRFDNRYRGWGRDGTGAPFQVSQRGTCSSGTCRIWDFSPRASDTQIRSIVPVPTTTDEYLHRWQAGTLAACSAIKGAVWQDATGVCSNPGWTTAGSCTGTWITGICSTRALRNAYEILNDGRGNENGLCESDEACIYTPNIGSYQGHGRLTHIGAISGGNFFNVDLYRYENNGY